MSGFPGMDLRPGVSEPVVLLISRREVEQAALASVYQTALEMQKT